VLPNGEVRDEQARIPSAPAVPGFRSSRSAVRRRKARVSAEFVAIVACDVRGDGVADGGHFVPEERPEAIVREVLAVTGLLDPQPDATPASDASPPNFRPRKDQSR
jgi:hypothetical protein